MMEEEVVMPTFNKAWNAMEDTIEEVLNGILVELAPMGFFSRRNEDAYVRAVEDTINWLGVLVCTDARLEANRYEEALQQINKVVRDFIRIALDDAK